MQARQRSTRISGLAALALACIAALVVAAGAMGSCVDDDTKLCASGLRCPAGYQCTYEGDGCRAEDDLCGNGLHEAAEREKCDDGNVQSGDGCSWDCSSTEICGDGIRELQEACDDGRNNGIPPSRCDTDCQHECGNGVLRDFEACDENLFRVTCLDFRFDRGTMACNDECVPDSRSCDVIGWTPEDRVADTGNLYGLWGDTNGHGFAVGEDESGGAGVLLHYTSPRWKADRPEASPGQLLDVWGSAPDDVFVVGSAGKALHFDGSSWVERSEGLTPQMTLRGVWTAGEDSDVIAVGDDATIVRYRRSDEDWSREALPGSVPADTVLEAVWGDGAGQLYAVGYARGRGVIVRHTGQGWELDDPQLTTPGLLDIWGSAEGDVFVVGQDGIILHHTSNSDTWSVMASNDAPALHSLWGSAADRVFAVGEHGTVLFYDGKRWSTLESATDLNLTAVWGIPRIGVFAAAENGRILRYHDWSWVAAPARPEGGDIRSLWANGLSDVYVLTEDVVYPQHFDGSAWSMMSEGFADLACLGASSSGGPSPLRHLLGGSDDDLYAVGDGNVILRHRPELGWTCMAFDASLPRIDVHRVWATDDGFLFAVGEIAEEARGIVLHYDGRSWQEMIRTDAPLRGIWGETGTELFVVGDDGTILHYDKPTPEMEIWEQIPCQLGEDPCGRLNAIWGSSRSDIHVVGENGLTLWFNGQGWSPPTILSAEHLLDLWGTPGHVFAVGASGSLFHRNGDAWAPVNSGTDQKLTSVQGLESPRVIMFGGEGATFRRILLNDDVLSGY